MSDYNNSTYNMEKYIKALELDKILEMLAGQASCADAAALARELRPVSDLSEVLALQHQTSDAHMLTARFGAPAFGGIKNVTNILRRAQSGGRLSMQELLYVAQTLRVMRTLSDWRKHSQGVQTTLNDMFEELSPNKYLEEKITSSILSEDEMADSASTTLANIRRKMRAMSVRIREQLDKLIRSSVYQKFLQDAIVTQRNDRYVVPVKAEFRSEISGLVHDTSSSGATVFIEPMSVVEANNDIRVLKAKELEEIDRILQELSQEAAGFADSIILGYESAVKLNLIFAKAHLAYKMKATTPIVNDKGIINLKKARHPLIDSKSVVPTHIMLGKDYDTLVITGPNTGGKTVSLKTIGLFSMMAMCGLMLPVSDESEISVYKEILCDIGDEQSIEQSLSTFSAHMTNIVKILENAQHGTLVLLDELGAGTDPVEGAALAMAIIEKLREKGAQVAATTHYAELKAFALQTDGVENACCEFDVATLRPTYRLMIGVPGRSNAFAISQRLGIEEVVVERARELVSNENRNFEDVVQTLEGTRQKLEEERAEVEKEKIQVQQALKKAQEHLVQIERDKEKAIDKARTEATNIVARTRAQADALINEIDEMRKSAKKGDVANKAKLRAKMLGLEETADPIQKKEDSGKYVLPRPLKAGDDVLIFDIDKKAIVLESVDKSGKVLVQAGIIKTRVPLSNLRLIEKQKIKQEVPRSNLRNVMQKAERSASTDLDLRGMMAFDALVEVDKFIDHAMLMGIHQITIIHGKGTGALRAAVHKHLKTHKAIRTFRLGVYGEGEAGVTIAEIK